MAEGFVPLERLLRAAATEREMPAVACDGEIDDEAARVRDEACPCAGAFSATRRFHAALADALDVALEGLLRDVACDVLARELSLAPADVAAIAVRALARYANESPVRVRAAS